MLNLSSPSAIVHKNVSSVCVHLLLISSENPELEVSASEKSVGVRRLIFRFAPVEAGAMLSLFCWPFSLISLFVFGKLMLSDANSSCNELTGVVSSGRFRLNAELWTSSNASYLSTKSRYGFGLGAD